MSSSTVKKIISKPPPSSYYFSLRSSELDKLSESCLQDLDFKLLKLGGRYKIMPRSL